VIPAWIFAALALLPVSAPPAKFVISGIVVDERTQQPIKHALVTVTQNEHPDRNASLFTSADGHFTFTDVPAAKYTLQAEVHGEQRTFEQDGQYSTGIVTGPGLDSEHIVFRFSVPGSIAIKIEDEEGEPVPGAQVTLFAKDVNAGWPQIRLVMQNATDNEGALRLAHLQPGTYYLAVMGRPWYAQNQPGPQTPEQQSETAALDVAYPLTYYPSTQNPSAAAPITLAAGEKVQLQMTLRAVPAIKISLEGVPGSRDPAHNGGIMSAVEATGPGGIRFQVQSYGFQQQDGAREIRGVAPGNYIVSVSTFGTPTRYDEPLGAAKISGSGEVKIDTSNLVRTAVAGHLSLEHPGPVNGLTLLLAQPANNQTAFCRVAQDGAFQCGEGRGLGRNLVPGYYQLRLVNTPDLYIKSVSTQGGRYAGGLLQIGEGQSIQLNVVAAKGRSRLDGIALRDQKPVSGAMILLVSRNAEPGLVVPRDQSDSDGTFTLRDVQPGQYYLLAIDHGRGLEYHNARVLAPYLAGAQKIDVPLVRDERVTVNVQARGR
jgi:hypothetical protein